MSKAPKKTPDLVSVTTINRDGSHYFLHPTHVSGRFTTRRRIFALFLIAVYVALPWIPINGEPAVFLDIGSRRFHLFGLTLPAQDLWVLFFLIAGVGFTLFVVTALFGRLWCGWACPFGLLSDLLTFLRKLVGADHVVLTRRWRNVLVWTKYVLLFASLGLSLLVALPAMANARNSVLLPFCQICFGKFASPFLSVADICWTNWSDWVTSALSILGLVVFVTFFLGLAIRRFYCRICPIGGITAPFNRFGLVSLHKEAYRCTKCGACARVCPVDNLTVYDGTAGQPVNACECTLCLRCVDACPERGCLEFTFLGKRVVGS